MIFYFGAAKLTPIEEQGETYILITLSILQKYGVLIGVCTVLICMILRYLAKIRKNTRLMSVFLMMSIGISILCLIFIFLPYFVLYNLQ
ncbi:hypothetical protein DFP98_11324 [Cohnella phaseoli]|uniref:Uncharacterized protein n=1 Tax=Cohnella phaseoli TaxID=456490 RepID=A0A3D9JPL5_9BACL|nr:hypothetical protein DFP98_11324 [Cohnella phaseoli]